MKILFEGESDELIKFFCPTVNRQEKPTCDAENFWEALLSGLIKGYKSEHCPKKYSVETEAIK